MIYIHALNAVDCELARIFNNGRMHETLVEMARDVGFDAHKCCDPSLSMEQRKIVPPRGSWQMNSADEHTIDDRAAITSRRFDLDKLNYAAVSELLLEQQALKEKREAAAARTTPNSAVDRYQGGSAGTGGGWHRHASPASSGGPRNEPKTSKKATAVDGNVRFRLQSNKPSSLTEESTVSRRMSSRGPIRDLFDQEEPSMLNDPSSTLVINGVIVQQGQAGGGVQQERATAAARPGSRSATSTSSRGGLSGFQNPFTKPPAEAPVNTQRTTEQQARRESSGPPRGIPLQHRTLARRPSGTQESGLSTPSTPPTHASSSSVQQQRSSSVKTQVQEQRLATIPPAEHKTDSQTAEIPTQEKSTQEKSSTQVQNLTAEIAKKLEATINQSLLEAIRGVYRGVPKIMEGRIQG
ncbi:hypothetical protein BDP81DRAFT_474876 [Colletotrichum phormii]|uniref:Uncharacterized protein n=1 Tax=Colletotrichum phormii TaxID=359342 RepID=A0AAI9ZHN9_9PEZI|nr:uncharacterized protein BDP81DRAFT_474876 [Colletotrichum phormii]KAK1624788.1 hypothetical protein BDP81DRAFT_474876 [Colletotrichum phormii]